MEPLIKVTPEERERCEASVKSEYFSGAPARFRFHPSVRMYNGRSAMGRHILASGLFSFNRGERSRYYSEKKLELVSYDESSSLAYIGEELRQDDMRVLVHLVELYRNKPVQAEIEFNVREFCTHIGWTRDSYGAAKVDKCLGRMQQSIIEVKRRSVTDSVQLVGHVKAKRAVRILSMREGFALILDSGATYLPLEKYKILIDGAATWMYGVLSAHRKVAQFKLSDLHRLSTTTSTLRAFGEMMRDVLPKLKAAGVVATFSFSRGILNVGYDKC